VLACSHYPYAFMHTFREACLHQDDLVTPFGMQIAHPEFYTGIWHTILYAPFYFLIHAPWGQYVFGLSFFAAFAWLLSRESKKPLLSLVLFLEFFPFLFQFIHDMGPVKFAMLLFPLGALIFRKVLQTPAPLSYGYAVLLALLFVSATEEKPFFLYTLPSLGLFALALTAGKDSMKELGEKIIDIWKPLAAAAATGGVCLLILFFSTNRDGLYYGAWLANLANNTAPIDAWLGAFFDFMTYWPSYAGNYYKVESDFFGAILFRLALAVFIIFCITSAVQSKFLATYSRTRLTLLLASFITTLVIFFVMGNEWAGHHFVFLWVPLAVLFADLAVSLSPGLAMIAVTGFLALNLWSVIALTQLKEKPESSSERAAIFEYFNDKAIASQAIINFSSWGGYYIQSLYGPRDQLVTYSEPYGSDNERTATLSPQDADQLYNLSQKTGRRIYNICFGDICNKVALGAIFGNRLTFEEIMPGLPNWHVFAASPRKGG